MKGNHWCFHEKMHATLQSNKNIFPMWALAEYQRHVPLPSK